MALVGQKIARDIMPSVDIQKLQSLFEQWHTGGITNFIALSGFWLTLIGQYKKCYPDADCKVECLHIDTVTSASWKKAAVQAGNEYTDGWLYSFERKEVTAKITYTGQKLLPFGERQNRLLIHGGGWGMGTYQSKIPLLRENRIPLDIIAYQANEIFDSDTDRFFMTDPNWSPMMKSIRGDYEFPPFAEIVKGKAPVYRSNKKYHKVLELSSEVKGIVSKPGGATLLDSLNAATPIVFLEPFGEYEQCNAELWVQNGFGIYFKDFESLHFSSDVLEELHQNLLKAKDSVPDYTDGYLKRNGDDINAATYKCKV